jgi:hypothetical protein
MKLLQFLISPGFSPLSIPINNVPPQDDNNASMVHFPYLHEQAQVDQPPTRVLSSPAPTIVEATLLPSQVTNIEIPNEEFEIRAIDFLNVLQVCTYQFDLDSSV